MADRVHRAADTPSSTRERLAAVLRQAKGLISVEHVMSSLSMDRKSAAKTLARWRTQGRLQRVGHGLYAAVPLEAQAPGQVLEDPWILVPSLFDSASSADGRRRSIGI
jgi:predicted transcriptional regulator of viral defense system